MKVLLCGYGHLGLALLQGLCECAQDCDVVGVFRWSARPESRNCWEPVEGLFQQHVEQAGLHDITCKGMNSYEFSALLQELKPDVVLVGSWGEILKKHLIEQPGMLFINCHPSKLPAHRGANPYSSVVRQQEKETGVTFHRMAPQIDAGAIFLQRAIPLDAEENGASVRDKCMAAAYAMVPELIRRLKAHVVSGETLEEIPQDASKQSYYSQLKPEDGQLNWQDSAEAMYRQMRALFPWVPSYSVVRQMGLPGRLRVIFYDPNFIDIPPEQQQQTPPGTIVAFTDGKLRVALNEPARALEIGTYQIGFGQAYSPPWLSRLLAPWVLRPGKRFENPA